MTAINENELLKDIPDVEFVRRELGRNLRERDLLRKLLKLAEDKAGIVAMQSPQTAGCSNG